MDWSLLPIYISVAIPFLIIFKYIFSTYFSRQDDRRKKLFEQGIGRGVDGFQTSVRKVSVPIEIIERIRRGEDVSAEEITRATQQQQNIGTTTSHEKSKGIDQDWLPNSSLNQKSSRRKK
ncbi:hypothetical protein BY996DRAFT_4584358 [Phakopsora pachyrhizi]|uniref:Uncharacterized protein n=1 Tax=Phakopsora pachyrhizi TaxID=170000 RepID=A0AAV0BJ00_PHAPC|nr:hypothetical protein BY996DRAFT_4584358 [Phakopsora pachyrhizi]CAH7685926.1 hypothetical protein PPACK8108_LOCUS20527 [Phakopsora pachyrhizi]